MIERVNYDLVSIAKRSALPLPPSVDVGVKYIGVTSTSTSGVTPSEWRGKCVDFVARIADVHILFASTPPTCNDTATSGPTVTQVIPMEQSRSWYFPQALPASDPYAYYAVKCASGSTAKLRAHVSSF